MGVDRSVDRCACVVGAWFMFSLMMHGMDAGTDDVT